MLDSFLALGRKIVSTFIMSSSNSINEKLSEPLNVFAESEPNKSFVAEVSDLINGKRKTISFMNLWFRSLYGSCDDDEDQMGIL